MHLKSLCPSKMTYEFCVGENVIGCSFLFCGWSLTATQTYVCLVMPACVCVGISTGLPVAFQLFYILPEKWFSTNARTYGTVSRFHRNGFGQLKLLQQVGEVRSHTCNLLIAICMLVISTWRKNKDTALPLFLLLAAQDEEAEAA